MPYVSVLNFRMGNNESVVGINHIHVLYVMTPLIMPVSTDAQCGQHHANDASGYTGSELQLYVLYPLNSIKKITETVIQ